MLRTIGIIHGMRALKIVTFLAAFLLFQIELIIAKMFLPHYGGSYLVWGACVVFFQAVLLLGYVFSHYAIGRGGMARYRFIHFILLFMPLLFFPGRSLVVPYGESQIPLALDVFGRLLTTIGPVFFVLSTISITTQMWFSASGFSKKISPYSLYAVSNLGSFGALLTYPFLFEVYWGLSAQINIWRVLYFLLIGLNLWAYRTVGVKEIKKEMIETAAPLRASDDASWFLWGAAGVMMFLSVNNMITNEIAPVPLLWIIPLCLYLLSFVFNFKLRPWCPSWIGRKIHLILGFSALLFFLVDQRYFPFMISLLLLGAAQFILCMYCQNQLISRKPKDDCRLTRFYVLVSLGGFAGGLFTTWFITLISQSLVEYLFGLLVIAATPLLKKTKFDVRPLHIVFILLLMVVLTAWPMLFVQYNVLALAMILMIFKIIYGELRKSAHALFLSLVCILVTAYYAPLLWNRGHGFYVKRNYYGICEVIDSEGIRRLYHGRTLHGAQYLQKERRGEPLSYYASPSALSKILVSPRFSFHRLGVIGLGTGTLSAYTREGQVMDFYELDPDIYAIADKYFTFIHQAKGKLNFIFGDARLSLDKNPDAKYDFLLVDAFGGDAVPVHLLTQEAVQKYRNHLQEKGILMFHVSNRYLDLRYVLARVADALGAHVCGKVSDNSSALGGISRWIVMTWDKTVFDTLVSEFGWIAPSLEILQKSRLWTDQYSSILPAIKLGDLLDSIKNFKPFYW